jgi:hypothetical protein
MNKFFYYTSILLVMLMVFLFVPAKIASAADLDVTASANKTVVFEGEEVTITLAVANNSGRTILLNNMYTEGAVIGLNNYNLLDGRRFVIDYNKVINFGQNLDRSFNVAVEYDGGSYAYSNFMDFDLDQIILDPGFAPAPEDTRKEFTVSANKTNISKRGNVTYTIYVKNIGNTFFTDFNVTLNGQSIKVFDLDPGMSKTFTHKKSYTKNTTEKFSYYHNYFYNGNSAKLTQSKTTDFNIKVSDSGNPPNQPASSDMQLTVRSLTETVMNGQEAHVAMLADNIGNIDFVDVAIYNEKGESCGGWPTLDSGISKDVDIYFFPESTNNYIFSIKAKDSNGKQYTFSSNEITIAVNGEAPTEPPAEEFGVEQREPLEPVNNPDEVTNSSFLDELNSSFYNQFNSMELLLVVFVLIVALVILITIGVIIRNVKKRKK